MPPTSPGRLIYVQLMSCVQGEAGSLTWSFTNRIFMLRKMHKFYDMTNFISVKIYYSFRAT